MLISHFLLFDFLARGCVCWKSVLAYGIGVFLRFETDFWGYNGLLLVFSARFL
jgi:hypothetical protein